MPVKFHTHLEGDKNIIEFDLKSKNNHEDIEDPIVPPAYYIEALILTISPEKDQDFSAINRLIQYKNLINVLSFAISENHEQKEVFEKFVEQSSSRLSQFSRNRNLNYDGLQLLLRDLPFELYETYDKWRSQNEELANEIENMSNCVAIAYPSDASLRDDSNCFFSLSGSNEDYIGTNKIPNWNLTGETKHLYSVVGTLLSNAFGVNFNECHLSDEIVRYVYFSNSNGSLNGKLLKNYISLPKDYKQRGQNSMFKRHYSCCEKKITTAMKFVNYDYPKLVANTNPINILSSYTFKVLKEPCKMCRPALIGCYNIFYYKDNDDYTLCFKISYDNSNLRTPLLVEKI